MEKPEYVEEPVVIPVISERLRPGVRKVRTGGVRVRKQVTEHEEVLEQQLVSEHAEVRRVIKNEVVSGPLPVRKNGDTIIVPVVKEVLKIEKQFVLTEELHITKRTTQETHAQTVVLQQENAIVERMDAEGNSIGPAEVVTRSTEPSMRDPVRRTPTRRNKIIREE